MRKHTCEIGILALSSARLEELNPLVTGTPPAVCFQSRSNVDRSSLTPFSSDTVIFSARKNGKIKIFTRFILPPFENGNLMPSHLKGNTLVKNFSDPKIS